MHSQQPPGVVQNWSTLQCSKQNTEQCGYDHAPVTRGRMRAQFPLPHGPMAACTISGVRFPDPLACTAYMGMQHIQVPLGSSHRIPSLKLQSFGL